MYLLLFFLHSLLLLGLYSTLTNPWNLLEPLWYGFVVYSLVLPSIDLFEYQTIRLRSSQERCSLFLSILTEETLIANGRNVVGSVYISPVKGFRQCCGQFLHFFTGFCWFRISKERPTHHKEILKIWIRVLAFDWFILYWSKTRRCRLCIIMSTAPCEAALDKQGNISLLWDLNEWNIDGSRVALCSRNYLRQI